MPPPLCAPLPAGTSVGAEAIFLVLVEAGGGGTPAVAIGAPVCGAGIIGGALEDEGEDAGGSIAVATIGVEDCGVRESEEGPRHRGAGQGLWSPLLTLAGAEAVFLIPVVVGGGGTPGQPILAPLRGAPGVGVALKDEGEVAFGSIGIPVAGLHHCSERGSSVLRLQLAPSDPPVHYTLPLPKPVPSVQNSSSSKWASPWMPWPGGKAWARSPSLPSKGYPSPCSAGKSTLSWTCQRSPHIPSTHTDTQALHTSCTCGGRGSLGTVQGDCGVRISQAGCVTRPLLTPCLPKGHHLGCQT